MNLDVVDDNGEHLLEYLVFTLTACIQDVLHWTLLPFKATGEAHMIVCVYSIVSLDVCLLQGYCGVVAGQWCHSVCV